MAKPEKSNGVFKYGRVEKEDVYLTNVVKIRPFKLSAKTGGKINRPPEREEINFFIPFLKMEIEAVNPNLIVTLGNVPLQAVTDDKKATIGRVSRENNLRWGKQGFSYVPSGCHNI